MKKIFKIIGIIVLLFIGTLIAIPFVLESKIETIVQNYADNNLDADFKFDAISLSLIRSFPKAAVSVENLNITNRAPFEDETLLIAKSLTLEMGITELFKGTEEPLLINEIIANELLMVLKTNKTGAVNYDILKKADSSSTPETNNSASFSFDIQNYELNTSAFTYIDDISNTAIYLTEINHSGKGIFSAETSQLDTNTEANVSMSVDSTNYLSNNNIKLKALIDLDLEQQKYTFRDNKGFINALPLEFNGFVKLLEDSQEVDISFKNPESSFKDFLALVPKAYAKNIENVNTTGEFTVSGIIKGFVSETTIPTLDINMRSNNASFKYPDLPKGVDNINIDVSIKNTSGISEETFIDINKLNFKIDQDVFSSEAHLKNLTDNMLINANIDGVLNLANIAKTYPLELETQLSGILKGKINTSFDMNAIETNAYQRIKNSGSLSISEVVFSSESLKNPLQINTADLTFSPGKVKLNSFDALTGTSDFSATGTISNLMGFLLSDKKLQGDFALNSNTFSLADFMTDDAAKVSSEETTTPTKTTTGNTSIKIPDFLDCTITANANKVLYDNLTLKNVKGELIIKDENANLKNMTTDIFNGQLALTGNVSTKEAKPKFNMQLGMQQFNISQSFEALDMLRALAPIAKVIDGKLNSTIDVSGLLDANLSPDLTTISGNALAEILTERLDTGSSPLISSLDSKLNFIDFSKLDLKDLKTKLSFENGQVSVKPFKINYKDIPIEISGSHSFSNTMNYSAVLQVPAKYLGGEVNRLIGKINDKEVNNISIPVTATIGGTFTSPNVTTDLTSGASNLTKQLIEIEKQKLIGQGTDKLSSTLGNLLGGNSKQNEADSTKTTSNNNKANATESVTKGVKNVLGGLLGGKKKTKDSTKN